MQQDEGHPPAPAPPPLQPQLAFAGPASTSSLLSLPELQAYLEAQQGRVKIQVFEQCTSIEEAIPLVALQEAAEREDEDMFFLVDVCFPLRKYLAWHQLFPRVRPFFAVKCCPNPVLIQALASIPTCGFDCASIAELFLVLSTGKVGPERIIFANPCKTEQAIEWALRRDIRTMTFDSIEELHKISGVLTRLRREEAEEQKKSRGDSSLPPSRETKGSGGSTTTTTTDPSSLPPSPHRGATTPTTDPSLPPSLLPSPELILRLRVPDHDSLIPLGEKYGASLPSFPSLFATALALNLPIVGISFHCGSGSHSAENFCEAIRMVKEVWREEGKGEREGGVELRVVDIGGGWPGWDGLTEPGFGGEGGKEGGGEGGVGVDAEGEEEGSAATAAAAAAAPSPLPLTCADIAQQVRPLLDELFPPSSPSSLPSSSSSSSSGVSLMSEPGRFFVEGSMVLFTHITARRWIDEEGVPIAAPEGGREGRREGGRGRRVAYVIGEGCGGCFKDAILCGESFMPHPLRVRSRGGEEGGREGGVGEVFGEIKSSSSSSSSRSSSSSAEMLYESLIVGPSGEAFDCVASGEHIQLPLLEEGDWLYFLRSGAYSGSIAAATSAVHANPERAHVYVATRYDHLLLE